MNIWKILGIEPTTDKRAIKRAYAAKTKETHPEEKPEEFKQLYEAYQAALAYVDYVRQVEQSGGSVTFFYRTDEDVTEADVADESSMETDVPYVGETIGAPDAPKGEGGQVEEELLSYFGERQKRQQQYVADFVKYWNEMKSPGEDSQMLDWWKAYLASEAFQDIRCHSQVISLIADEIDDKFFYGINDIKILFWDAYGFQGDGKTAYLDYEEDELRLYRSLYPAYERQRLEAETEKKRREENKITYVIIGTVAAAILISILISFVNTHRLMKKETLLVVDYLTQKYPETTFSAPEHIGKDGFGGGNVYTLCSPAHPELEAAVTVHNRYVEGKKQVQFTDNYDLLLFEHYAEQYGLEAEIPFIRLCYPSIDRIDAFCESVEKMFHEQEELQTISEVSIYTEDVLFPEVLQQGGVPDFQFAELQTYDLRQMSAEELSAALREAYMLYMFQYESWNITPAQYREWGAAYEKKCEEWENDEGEWLNVDDPDTGEFLCRLFVSTYEKINENYSLDGASIAPRNVRMMSVGNAYHFLRKQGADIIVDENGRGFDVKFYGTNTWFGYEPEVKFDDLRDCY